MGDTLSRFEDPPSAAAETFPTSAHLPPPFGASAAQANQSNASDRASADIIAAGEDDDDDMPDLQSRHFRPGEEEGYDSDEDGEAARDLIAYFEDATAAYATAAAGAVVTPPGECNLSFFV